MKRIWAESPRNPPLRAEWLGGCGGFKRLVRYGEKEEKRRGRRIARLIAEMPLTADTSQAFQDKRCIISHQTKLYDRGGFGSSEFTKTISSLANLQLCVLHASMTVASTSRESLCSMPVEKQICPSGIWSEDQFLQRIRRSLIILLWLHDFYLYHSECFKNRCLGAGYICISNIDGFRDQLF